MLKLATAAESGNISPKTLASRRPYLVYGCAALVALLLISHSGLGRATAFRDGKSTARQLLSRDLYAGLDPAWAAAIPSQDVRPHEYLKHVPESKRTLDMDFREARKAGSRSSAFGLKKLLGIFGGSRIPTEQDTYLGHTCLSHYPGQICPVLGQCAQPDPNDRHAQRIVEERGSCVHWGKGLLPNPPFALSADEVNDSRSQIRLTHVWDQDGVFKDDIWQPVQPRVKADEYRFFTPNDMHRCLAGKRILFQGDSLIRQFFNRLITYARHLPTIVEQYYGTYSVYTVYTNGTDEWKIDRGSDESIYSRHLNAEQGVLYRVFYNWMERVDDFDRILEPTSKMDVDVSILGINYWYPLNFDFSRLPGALDRLWESGWPGILSWFTAPQEFAGKDAWWHVGQNALLRSLTSHRSAVDGRKIHVLPSDRIVEQADIANYPQRNCRRENDQERNECLHDAHFGCGFLALYPETLKPGLDGFKAPLGMDCRDTFNLAVLQTWLNSICV